MDNSNLSINNLVETAMAFSMAEMFTKAMGSISRANLNAIETTFNQPPPRYIYAVINSIQQGPFSLGEILERISAGEITPETYIWKVGMAEWRKANDVEDIRPSLEQLPPPIFEP